MIIRTLGFNQLIIFSLLLTFFSCSPKKENDQYGYLYRDLPFEMPRIKRPVFPDNQVSLLDFGGVPDGITLNTLAFKEAIETLSNKGGGVLNVPQGIWYTGPVELKSHINLHLHKGALILFTTQFEDYPLIETSFEGLSTRRCQSPISGRNLENIAITGEGAIDGNGQAWRPLKREKVTDFQWESLTSNGGVFLRPDYWFPSEKSMLGSQNADMNVPRTLSTDEEWNAIKDFLRPVMISLIECKNVLLEGVLFQNSPSWNIHPLMCENVIIDNITVKNPSYAANGDGLDLESCKNTIIVNSTFDVGDDGICIKSGKDEDGRKRARPTENVLIDNCIVFKWHGGFVVGSEMSGGVRNIFLTNCQFLGTDVGLRFKSKRGRGGLVENIFVSNVSMTDILTESFLFDLFYIGKSAVEFLVDGDLTPEDTIVYPVTEETPAFRNIHFKDIVSRNARRAMFFNGLPEMNIENIHLENIVITSKIGAELVESKNIVMKNVSIHSSETAPLMMKNVSDFSAQSFICTSPNEQVIHIIGEKSANIQLPKLNESLKVYIGEEVDSSAVSFQ